MNSIREWLKEVDWGRITSIAIWIIIVLAVLFNITHRVSCSQYSGEERERCKAYYQDNDYRATSQDVQP